MYENFFGFAQRPFAAAPSADCYIPVASLEQARQTVVRCVERAEGPALVVGATGTGKSLLCQVLARHFKAAFNVATLCSARLCTRRALLQNIMFELNLPYRGLDESDLRLALIDHLQPRAGGLGGLVLIVDEAHTLPVRLLEEVRQITNLVRDGQPRVRLVLVGGTALEERLASPKLEAMQQRIAGRCYLHAMNREETQAYIQGQLFRAGVNPDLIMAGDARQAVYQATDGIPRLVNQICDHALVLALEAGQPVISRNLIEAAWADLQQLPAPWHENSQAVPSQAPAAESNAIEFGQLDEELPGLDFSMGVGSMEIGTAASDSISAQLDRIDQGLAALRQSSLSEGSTSISRTAAPQITLADISSVEVTSLDPFGTNFDEEEIVIDRYASLEARTLASRPKVSSVEGRAIGKALESLVKAPPAVGKPRLATPNTASSTTKAPSNSTPLMAHVSWRGATEIVPAIDPTDETNAFPAAASLLEVDTVLPDPSASESAFSRSVIPMHLGLEDDRDMIVIEEHGQHNTAEIASSQPARRREYRNLFSTLRNQH